MESNLASGGVVGAVPEVVVKVAAKTATTSTSSTGLSQQSLDNLKYVIMFGAPVVAGVALYWYMSRKGESSSVKDTLAKKAPSASDIRADAQRRIEKQIQSTDPTEKATGYKNKGNGFFKQKKDKEAIECYTEAIKVCPVDKREMISTFYQNRAAAYENLNLTDNVIQDSTKAIELNNKYSKAYFRRARAYEVKGEFKKCLEDSICCAIIEQFQHENSLMLTDKTLKCLASQVAKDIYDTRKVQLPSKSFIRNFINSFIEDPVLLDMNSRMNNQLPEPSIHPPSGYDKALQALIEENYEMVRDYCSDEIANNLNKEKVDKAFTLRATFHLMQGRVPETLDDIEKLLSRDNVNVKIRVNALIKKATAEVHQERMKEALESYEKAVELDPNNADIYLHRGQVFLLQDQIDQTLKNLVLASSLRPDSVSAIAQLAYTKFKCGTRFGDRVMQDEGMAEFKSAMQKFPDAAEVDYLYAQLMLEVQNFDTAEAHLKKFMEKDPTDMTGFVHLGTLALQARQDVPKAIGYIQQAIDKDPKCQFAYETLGTLLIQQGRLKEGIDLLEKGISLAQSEGEVTHLVSLKLTAEVQSTAIERLGRPDLAMQPGMMGALA